MRYFFDVDYVNGEKYSELVSIGIVCEDGRELYLENAERDPSYTDVNAEKNIFSALYGEGSPKWEGVTGGYMSREAMKEALLEFIFVSEEPWEIWGYRGHQGWSHICLLWNQYTFPPDFYDAYRDIVQILNGRKIPVMLHLKKGCGAIKGTHWVKNLYEMLNNGEI